MSIILDALKKSETDQQRQSGPALFEVKVAPPKARFPVWAIAIVALLVVNTVIVGYLLLRRPARGAETAATNTSAPPAASAPNPAAAPPRAAAPAPSTPPPGATSPMPSGPSGPAYAGSPAPASYSQPNGAPAYGSGQAEPAYNTPPTGTPPASPPPNQFSTASNQPGTGAAEGGMPGSEPTLANRTRDAVGAAPPANPDDYAPATEPDSPLFKGHVKRGTDSGLVLYQDAAVVPGANLPQLRLDLHVYAPKPQDRFALINMRKMHEGDSLPEGVRVESITPDGVIMSHNGSRFLLPRD